jgi:hypothetical protein
MQGFFWQQVPVAQINSAGNGGLGVLGHNRLTKSKDGNGFVTCCVDRAEINQRRDPMKGIIAWALGVPIIVIILLYVTNIF